MLGGMDWISWVTFGIAVTGAVLGVVNAYWMIRRDAVRIRVRFVRLLTTRGEDLCGIEVTNQSYFALTLTEVAFRGGNLKTKRAVIADDYFKRTSLPLRMEARTAVTIVGGPELAGEIRRWGATHCSATTACGITVKARIARK